MDVLPERVRLVAAPGALRDAELDVLGWRTENGETALICRLVDGSSGTIPARWTDLPPASQQALAVAIARLVARLVARLIEAARDE